MGFLFCDTMYIGNQNTIYIYSMIYLYIALYRVTAKFLLACTHTHTYIYI